MKKIVFLLLIACLPVTAFSQPWSVRKAFHRYGHSEGVTRVTVPGVVIRMASWMVDDAETEALLKGIKKVKVLVAEGDENLVNPEFTAKVMQEIQQNKFEEMLTVNDQEDQVGIFIREGRNHNKELVLFANGKNENTIVYLKGKITPELLKKLSSNPGNTRVSRTISI